jgi:hypothetical protein
MLNEQILKGKRKKTKSCPALQTKRHASKNYPKLNNITRSYRSTPQQITNSKSLYIKKAACTPERSVGVSYKPIMLNSP